MTDVTDRLHAEIDAELDRLPTSADLADNDEPELEPFATRLRSLHDALAAVENDGRAR